MPVRAVIAALIALLSSNVRGEPERKPWHALVSAPRAGLPAVTIDLGYPGPYIPTLNAPITLRATASDVPFDGYIGYHFAVRDRLTLDTPVIARARLRAHESWSLTTTATLRKCCIQNIQAPREIAVEWRNRAMQWVASQSAGVPPWTSWDQDLLPLVIIGSGAEINAPDVLGGEPYVERAEGLPDHAQWYSGFSAVVIPVAAWLDLPERIREAIFGSGVYVVFFGFPRPDQHLGRLDQTLLPVAFRARPGSYDAPWPYRNSRRMPAAAPLSWIGKEDSDRIGGGSEPVYRQDKCRRVGRRRSGCDASSAGDGSLCPTVASKNDFRFAGARNGRLAGRNATLFLEHDVEASLPEPLFRCRGDDCGNPPGDRRVDPAAKNTARRRRVRRRSSRDNSLRPAKPHSPAVRHSRLRPSSAYRARHRRPFPCLARLRPYASPGNSARGENEHHR